MSRQGQTTKYPTIAKQKKSGTLLAWTLALDAPHAPVAQSAVTSVAGRALRDAGISGEGAAHLLRHTAACGVLAAGGGLAGAGQLLRHAGPQVTAVSARSDLAALRTVARPWPEEGGPR